MAVAVLSIDLEARLARLEGDLNRATSTIDKQAQRMRKSFDDVGVSVQRVFAGLSAGVAASALQTYFTSAINGVDKLNDLKDATGSTIENLSALEDIGARTGTSIDTVGDAVGKLNKLLNESKPDSEQARALASIGLSAEELKKLDPSEALRILAVRLAGFADDGNKARLVQELLGKSYREAAPFLKDLAAAGQLNATVTTKQAEEAEKFNQELFRLQKNSTDTARAIAGPLVSGLNDAIERFRAARKEGKSFFDIYVDNVKQFYAGDKPKELPSFRPSQNYGDTLPSVPVIAPKPATAGGKSDAEKAADAYKRLAEAIGRVSAQAVEEIDTGARLSPLQAERVRLLQELTSGQYAYTAAQKASITAGAASLDVLDAEVKANQELLRVVRERADFKARDYQAGNDGAAANDAAARDKLRGLLADTDTGRLQAVTEDVRLLNEAFDSGRVGADQWAEAIRAATSRLPQAKTEADGLKKTVDDLGFTFASAFEDAIVGGGKLSDILKGLEQDILRIAARKLITEPLAKAASGFLGGLLGSANGNAFDGAGLVPFANGGIVNGAMPFKFGGNRLGVMGEAGPEGVLPLKRGRNGKLGVIAQGGGQTIINQVTVQGAPGQSRDDAMQQGVLIGRGIQRAMSRNS